MNINKVFKVNIVDNLYPYKLWLLFTRIFYGGSVHLEISYLQIMDTGAINNMDKVVFDHI